MLLCVLLLVFLSCYETGAANPKILIDHDGGGDDAMAIFMALLYEKYFDGPQVVGLTTTHANVNESQVFKNTQRILDIAKRRDIPIYRGQKQSLLYTLPTDHNYGIDGLGDNPNVTFEPIEAQSQDGVMAIIELSKKYEGELTVVSLGALTNIALVLTLDPGFLDRITQLYVAAGNIYGPEYPDPEFNAIVDVEAYYMAMMRSRPEKVTVVPYSEVKREQRHITREWRENVLGTLSTAMIHSLNMFEEIELARTDRWTQLDQSTMSIVLKESLVEEYRYSNNSIILCGKHRGLNTNTFTGFSDANIKMVYSILEEPYKQFLYEIFSAELLHNKLDLENEIEKIV